MSKHSKLALVIVLACIALSTPSHANTGRVFVEVAKAGFIIGAGAGRGVLTYGGRDYRFRMSGLSLGLTAGVSTTRFVGHASNLRHVRDFAGTYAAVGIGGAWVLGAADVRLKNDKGVIITLHGGRAGIEIAANLSGITIEF
jgi:lipid-binding SYLF domain-containing protein